MSGHEVEQLRAEVERLPWTDGEREYPDPPDPLDALEGDALRDAAKRYREEARWLQEELWRRPPGTL